MLYDCWNVISVHLRTRVDMVRRAPDTGYVSETTLMTALLIALGVAAMGLLTAKVIAVVLGIEFG